MSEPTMQLWHNAMYDAAIIMGPIERGRGRPREAVYRNKADEDPMAWWCLVELLVSYAQGRKGR